MLRSLLFAGGYAHVSVQLSCRGCSDSTEMSAASLRWSGHKRKHGRRQWHACELKLDNVSRPRRSCQGNASRLDSAFSLVMETSIGSGCCGVFAACPVSIGTYSSLIRIQGLVFGPIAHLTPSHRGLELKPILSSTSSTGLLYYLVLHCHRQDPM